MTRCEMRCILLFCHMGNFYAVQNGYMVKLATFNTVETVYRATATGYRANPEIGRISSWTNVYPINATWSKFVG